MSILAYILAWIIIPDEKTKKSVLDDMRDNKKNTTEENIEFILLLQKRPKAERENRVLELLGQIGLKDKAKKRPSELSGGQQQRVAVARALAPKPQFILADEPTANLDTVSASNLLDMMLKLNKEENMTFVFSTHDQRVIDRARRVITLEDGKIVSDTNPTPVDKVVLTTEKTNHKL